MKACKANALRARAKRACLTRRYSNSAWVACTFAAFHLEVHIMLCLWSQLESAGCVMRIKIRVNSIVIANHYKIEVETETWTLKQLWRFCNVLVQYCCWIKLFFVILEKQPMALTFHLYFHDKRFIQMAIDGALKKDNIIPPNKMQKGEWIGVSPCKASALCART